MHVPESFYREQLGNTAADIAKPSNPQVDFESYMVISPHEKGKISVYPVAYTALYMMPGWE